MSRKEELELAIKEQQEIADGVNKKLGDLKREFKDTVEMPKRAAMVGRYFKHQDRYGPEDDERWTVYIRVVKALKGYMELEVISLCKDSDGEISVDTKDYCSVVQLGEEITESEFLVNWQLLENEMTNAVKGVK